MRGGGRGVVGPAQLEALDAQGDAVRPELRDLHARRLDPSGRVRVPRGRALAARARHRRGRRRLAPPAAWAPHPGGAAGLLMAQTLEIVALHHPGNWLSDCINAQHGAGIDITEEMAHALIGRSAQQIHRATALQNRPLLHQCDPITQSHGFIEVMGDCLLYTSPSPRDRQKSRMPA